MERFDFEMVGLKISVGVRNPVSERPSSDLETRLTFSLSHKMSKGHIYIYISARYLMTDIWTVDIDLYDFF